MTREEAIRWLEHIKTREIGWDEYSMQESFTKIRERCEQSIRDAISMAIEALKEPRPKIAFACDGRKCGKDCSECGRTTDIEHAKNFIRLGEIYLERSPVAGPCNADHDHDGGEWIDITEGLTGGDSSK